MTRNSRLATSERLATLYIVATPLGNLSDLSPRAAQVLREVPVVAAEDTRRTRQLLHHLDAHPRLLSFHAHSEPEKLEALVAELERGHEVALVSDAGTPGVSDPGANLVRTARERGGRVVPIPGPSAVTTALSASGFSADRFTFLGFLLLRIPLATYLAHKTLVLPATGLEFDGLALGVVGAWYAMVIDVVFRCMLFVARFVHGGWQRVEV